MEPFCGRVRLGVLCGLAGLCCLSSVLTGCGGSASKDVPIVFDVDGTSHRVTESDLPQLPDVPAEGITVYVSDNRPHPEPISGAEVDLIIEDARQLQQTTDGNGTCHFSDVPAGEVALSVDHDDYPPNRGVTTFQGASNLLVVKLDANNEVLCKVYAADTGEPIPQYDLLFRASIPGFRLDGESGFVSVQPNEDGIFTATRNWQRNQYRRSRRRVLTVPAGIAEKPRTAAPRIRVSLETRIHDRRKGDGHRW